MVLDTKARIAPSVPNLKRKVKNGRHDPRLFGLSLQPVFGYNLIHACFSSSFDRSIALKVNRGYGAPVRETSN